MELKPHTDNMYIDSCCLLIVPYGIETRIDSIPAQDYYDF